MKNEILEEVWKARDEFAKKHDYDLNAMVVSLQEAEKQPWSKVVDGPRRTAVKSTKPADTADPDPPHRI